MNSKLAFSVICIGCASYMKSPPAFAAGVILPPGFEDVFESRQSGIFDVIYDDVSIGSLSAEYDHDSVLLSSPRTVVEQITSEDMPGLIISKEELVKKLSTPLQRVSKQEFGNKTIVAWINDSDATLHLVFPASMFSSPDSANDRTFIVYKRQPGFVHNHNLNYLSDNYGQSFSWGSNDTLNLTGNSYIKSAWSYSKDINLSIDELALYLESNSNRFKAGRQRLNDNFVYSTPSLSYSFFNPVSFDGVSLGYMTDNYLHQASGAASPVTIYMPMAGTVEVYRNGKIIDLQQFPAGVQQLNTDSWPMGGYDVQLVSKLVNGAREVKTQPFFKRSGMFRSGDLEYTLQMGRYDERQGQLSTQRNVSCVGCVTEDPQHQVDGHNLAGITLGYTTQSATSLGGGTMWDDNHLYFNSSLDIPLDLWFAERLYTDAIIGNDTSTGYQVGMSKNLSNLGLNASYRSNRYNGDEANFRRYGVVPAYDFDYMQFGVSTFLPWNVGFSVTYSLNTLYQQYQRQDKSKYKTWDATLNRDFTLTDRLNLRVDIGYHQGINEYTTNHDQSISIDTTQDNRVFAQFTLGMREQSYNHYQSLYLRDKVSDNNSENGQYSADYSLDLSNPEFDRTGQYSVTASASGGANNDASGGAGVSIDNALGYTSAGTNRSLGNGTYNQYYLSQRSGFAIGEGEFAYGKTDNNTALIVDATDLPKDQYFDVRNYDSQSVVVKGGTKTTLNVLPYQKIAPTVEQVYTGDETAFYNLTTKSTSTFIMPGQVYNVKVAATKNQTVAGRIYYQSAPLKNARVVGGNALTDDEGLFIGDFTLEINSKLENLTVKKDGHTYSCPILDKNVKMTQGVMQIREVECEIQ